MNRKTVAAVTSETGAALAALAAAEYAGRNARAVWRTRGQGREAREAAMRAEMEAMRAEARRRRNRAMVLTLVVALPLVVLMYWTTMRGI